MPEIQHADGHGAVTGTSRPTVSGGPTDSPVAAHAGPETGGAAVRRITLDLEAWHRLRPLVLLVPAAQLLAILWIIWFRTPSAPWWDEWATVNLIQHANQGTLTLGELWAPHFGTHRIVLPRLLDIAVIELTHWNRQIEMTVDLAFAVASALLLFSCVRKTLRSTDAAFALIIPLSLVLFSLGQYGNWFFPFQGAFILTAFGVAVSVRAFRDEPLGWGAFALGALGALIATLSSAPGLIAWAAFVPSAWRMGYRKFALWVACGCASWIAYLINLPRHAPNTNPIQAVAFVLAFLGMPLGYPSLVRAQLFGALGILLLCGNLWLLWRARRNLTSLLIWIDLALFGFGAAALTAYGRAGTTSGSAARAISGDYPIYAALWWVAIVVVVGLGVQQLLVAWGVRDSSRLSQTFGLPSGAALRLTWATAALNIVALLAVCGGGLLVNRAGYHYALYWLDTLRANQTCIVHAETAPDSCLGLWFPLGDKPAVLGNIEYLRQHHLAIFADPSTR